MQSTTEQVISSLLGNALQEQQNNLANPNYKSLTEMKGKVPIQVISEISPAAAYTMGEAFVMALVKAWQISRQSLLYRVISVPGNKEIYLETTPKKNIELCLIIMDSLKDEDIEETTANINSQTFTKWKLYFPAAGHQGEPKEVRKNVFKMRVLSNRVHNIEKTVAKYCPHKGYAVLLNKGDRFVSATTLEDIAKQVKKYHTAGLFVNILLPDGK